MNWNHGVTFNRLIAFFNGGNVFELLVRIIVLERCIDRYRDVLVRDDILLLGNHIGSIMGHSLLRWLILERV